MFGIQRNNESVKDGVSSAANPDRGLIEKLIGNIKNVIDSASVHGDVLKEIREDYKSLKREDKPMFFVRLVSDIEVRQHDLAGLLDEISAGEKESEIWPKILLELRSGLESPRLRFFRHFIRLPGGLKFLLDFRADVLAAQRLSGLDLGLLDYDLTLLFETWFQAGFLFLQEITLNSPYRQIELIMNGDLVHPMTGLEEMKRRLGRDRRCFALYHRAMPEEPVIFIEVALAEGIVRSIQEIIVPGDGDSDESAKKDTAVFYSINNTQNGLAGLGLGNLLIFQVVDFIKKDMPNIKSFCTLSPMPGFWRRYLKPMLEDQGKNFKMKRDGLEKLFDRRTKNLIEKEYQGQGGKTPASFPEILLSIFSTPQWTNNEPLVINLAKPLCRLAYIYLAEEKNHANRPIDPVANFHLSNGASLAPANVNFGANWSAMGLERSLSLMVNYVYSQHWRQTIAGSLTRLGGLVPGLAKPRLGRRVTDPGLVKQNE